MKRYLILTTEGYRIVKGSCVWVAIATLTTPVLSIQTLNY
jgi:hypothetical protein